LSSDVHYLFGQLFVTFKEKTINRRICQKYTHLANLKNKGEDGMSGREHPENRQTGFFSFVLFKCQRIKALLL
jgi:hypothetical protein